MKEKEKLPLYVYTKHATILERDLFEQGANKNWLKINASYNNVFNSVQRYSTLFKSLKCEVAYGYMEISPKLYLRHCFLVKEDMVIDTNVHFYAEQEEVNYIAFAKMDVYDYVKAILDNQDQRDLAFTETLKEYEDYWYEYAEKNGITSVN